MFVLRNEVLEVHVSSLGAIIQALWVTTKDGRQVDVALGHTDMSEYLVCSPFRGQHTSVLLHLRHELPIVLVPITDNQPREEFQCHQNVCLQMLVAVQLLDQSCTYMPTQRPCLRTCEDDDHRTPCNFTMREGSSLQDLKIFFVYGLLFESQGRAQCGFLHAD